MKAKLLIPVVALVAFPFIQSKADDGADMFKQNCGACHTVGKGKLVGPDLKGVETRHAEAWLLKWIKGSQAMVQAGDKDAVKLFNDNSNIPMPDQALSDDQIKTILGYIKAGGDQPAATAATTPAPNGTDNVAAATQKAAAAQSDGSSLLTSFSFTEYMLMFLMGLMLIVIYVMGISIKSLTERVRERSVQ